MKVGDYPEYDEARPFIQVALAFVLRLRFGSPNFSYQEFFMKEADEWLLLLEETVPRPVSDAYRQRAH